MEPLSAEAYARQLAALLPRGAAWVFERDSTADLFFKALAEELARVDARALEVLEEADPRTTDELLPDWEAQVASPGGSDPARRRAAVVAKLVYLGGQTPRFFIDLAAAFGFTITITEFRAFRAGLGVAGDPCCSDAWAHVWQITHPSFSWTYFEAGDPAGTPLRTWTGERLLFWIGWFKPAHTVLLFNSGVPS